jgi:hypothetical protein
MRLKAAKRTESPTTLLETLKRIHQQTVETSDGKTLTGLTEITPVQKSLFAALELTPPTPSDLPLVARMDGEAGELILHATLELQCFFDVVDDFFELYVSI